jgi:transcriptional regulator with XRE-family HTH domain
VPSLDDNAQRQLRALGDFIKAQRTMAELSLRELAARTNVSNPYLSQIERGLHEPSVRVLKAIAGALNVSAESLLRQAGLLEAEDDDDDGEKTKPSTEATINADASLKPEQRRALLALYRSFAETNDTQNAKKPRA